MFSDWEMFDKMCGKGGKQGLEGTFPGEASSNGMFMVKTVWVGRRIGWFPMPALSSCAKGLPLHVWGFDRKHAVAPGFVGLLCERPRTSPYSSALMVASGNLCVQSVNKSEGRL